MAAHRLTQSEAFKKLTAFGWSLLTRYVDFYTPVTARHSCGVVLTKAFCSFNKYCTCNRMSKSEMRERSIQAYFEKTGYRNPAQDPKVQAKMRVTNLRLHGVEHPLKSEKIKRKMKRTVQDRYGVDNVSQDPKIKKRTHRWQTDLAAVEVSEGRRRKTCLKKYGSEHFFSSEAAKSKLVETYLKKYGVRNPMQVRSIHEQAMKTGYRTSEYVTKQGRSLDLQGAEPTVAKWLEEFECQIRVSKLAIPYTYNNEGHRYFPDFDCVTSSGRPFIVEVKSQYTLIRNLDINLAKFRAANRYARKRQLNFVLVVANGDGSFESTVFPTKRKLAHLIR